MTLLQRDSSVIATTLTLIQIDYDPLAPLICNNFIVAHLVEELI